MVSVRFPKIYRQCLYGMFLLSCCSGSSFFILKTWFVQQGEYGLVKHAWQYPALQIHGAMAFLMMVGFGFVLGAHMPKSWKTKEKRKTGILLLTMPSLLILSGYLLYYVAQDTFREWLEYTHLAIGLLLPLGLTLHIATKVKHKHVKQKNEDKLEKI